MYLIVYIYIGIYLYNKGALFSHFCYTKFSSAFCSCYFTFSNIFWAINVSTSFCWILFVLRTLIPCPFSPEYLKWPVHHDGLSCRIISEKLCPRTSLRLESHTTQRSQQIDTTKLFLSSFCLFVNSFVKRSSFHLFPGSSLFQSSYESLKRIKTSVHVSHFNFIFLLNWPTMKMVYESCRRFTQDSSTANENWLEFSFDFWMSECEKKGVENGVDVHKQKRKKKKSEKEPLSFSEWEMFPVKGFSEENIFPQASSKDSEHYGKSKEN